MDRTLARVCETAKIADILSTLINQIIPGASTQEHHTLPQQAKGVGLVDTTRGALGDWLKINDQKIAFYQIITPSVWNLSTRSGQSLGPSEHALIGTELNDSKNPVEIGRILRSFDPCVSCATHLLIKRSEEKTYRVVS